MISLRRMEYLKRKGREQAKKWMHETILYGLEKSFYSKEDISQIVY